MTKCGETRVSAPSSSSSSVAANDNDANDVLRHIHTPSGFRSKGTASFQRQESSTQSYPLCIVHALYMHCTVGVRVRVGAGANAGVRTRKRKRKRKRVVWYGPKKEAGWGE